MTAPVPTARPRDPARSLRAIGSSILGVEVIVVCLAIPVVVNAEGHVSALGVAGLGAIAVLDLVVAALMSRHERESVVAGSVLQLGTVAAGVMSGVLLFVALLFGLLWVGWLTLRYSYHVALRNAGR
jgi:hypothetical protein